MRLNGARLLPGQRAGEVVAERVVVAASDMTSSDMVRDLFNRCRRLLRHGAQRVIIDLQCVQAADTKLLACLIALHRLARSASARLELCMSSAVLDVARICRLEWLADEFGPAAHSACAHPHATPFTCRPSRPGDACPWARAS